MGDKVSKQIGGKGRLIDYEVTGMRTGHLRNHDRCKERGHDQRGHAAAGDEAGKRVPVHSAAVGKQPEKNEDSCRYGADRQQLPACDAEQRQEQPGHTNVAPTWNLEHAVKIQEREGQPANREHVDVPTVGQRRREEAEDQAGDPGAGTRARSDRTQTNTLRTH